MGGFAALNSDEKLAFIARRLAASGIEALVMGGHAARYYGIDRNTSDFDFVTSIAVPIELKQRISIALLFPQMRELHARISRHTFQRETVSEFASIRLR
jgi:hypothetical protein